VRALERALAAAPYHIDGRRRGRIDGDRLVRTDDVDLRWDAVGEMGPCYAGVRALEDAVRARVEGRRLCRVDGQSEHPGALSHPSIGVGPGGPTVGALANARQPSGIEDLWVRRVEDEAVHFAPFGAEGYPLGPGGDTREQEHPQGD